MADYYSDTPLGPQEQAIQRRQKIAEMLMQQGQTPIDTNRMAGVYVAPVSPLEAIGKLAQAYFGNKRGQEANAEYEGLAKQRQQGVADALAQYQRTAQGTPAVTQQVEGEISPARQGYVPSPEQFADRPNFNVTPGEVTPAVRGMTTQEVSPAIAGNPRAAVTQAMMSQYPELQRFAAVEMANQNRKEDLASTQAARAQEAQAAREARAQELELRLQDARTSNADRLAMQKELAVMNHDTQVAIANQASEDRRFAVANRAQAEHAPSMTEIVDPNDPTRLLRVDARTYKGGTVGSPGVLGISGKEPTAAAKEQKQFEGKQGLAGSLDALESAYTQLDKMGGIVNNQKGTLHNLVAKAGSSGLGQMVGGALGTDEQSLRNEIKGTVPLLILDIKNATGASAQQMNSDRELQNFMRAASDPNSDIKSNLKLLKNLRDKYVGKSAAPAAPSAPRVVDW